MTLKLDQLLRYWRASLADAAFGQGKFRQRDDRTFIRLSSETLKTGCTPKEQTGEIFKGLDKNITQVSVTIWPLVTVLKVSHGTKISTGQPEVVAPVVTEATIDRDGVIRPMRSVLARDVLSPLGNDAFFLGSVEEFDNFLLNNPLTLNETSDGWQQYLDHCRAMVNSVKRGWPGNDPLYTPTGFGYLKVATDAAAASAQIIKLYDALLHENISTPLLQRIALPPEETRELPKDVETIFANRLGHASDVYPLADQQRQVLSHLSTGQIGDILAVNGPPGTGKTTMLLSAIADAWVRAALEKSTPPVIVAASSNNQAVTNIIDAFGKDFAEGEGAFAGRWLPEIGSYGLFLVAQSKEAAAAQHYQTEAFHKELESKKYFLRAQEAFLLAARNAFPELDNPSVDQIVDRLHQMIRDEAQRLMNIDACRTQLAESKTKLASLLNIAPETLLRQLGQVANNNKVNYKNFKTWITALETYEASEPIMLSLFGFLPPVARKRALRVRSALEQAGCTLDFSSEQALSAIHARIRLGLENSLAINAEIKSIVEGWRKATKGLELEKIAIGDFKSVDRLADTKIRFQLFRLACHYWEGRWLLEMASDLDKIVSSHEKTGKKAVVPRWQRRMMLTPCAVSTFASLPGKMKCQRYEGGEFTDETLFEFIDLLIVDEAGQVLPEVAAAAFSLAKRALVIGDTKQIEPISSVSHSVDMGNLRETGILASDFSEQDEEEITRRGIRSLNGSAMHLAQNACPYHPYPKLERGFYLFEHRRCHDEIISFCNRLCYGGALLPMRGTARKDAVVPAMGYLHIDGMARSIGSSRINSTEANTIARWLEANRQDIERQYGAKLESLVGIVTPFSGQVREITNACKTCGIGPEMTIGTVHSLQGAERPIIIFSPVYTKHANGGFIDMSPSMLNVTVSRAKDSFMVFGDMDVFATAAEGTPRQILADFLFSEQGHALDFEPQQREDLQEKAKVTTLRHAAEHDEYLLSVLASDARQFTIVSPWINASTMQQTGFLDGFRQATARGAKIDVYVDPLLNQPKGDGQPNPLEQAKSALTDIGVNVHEVRRLHSKIVTVDTDQLCIGSFNWLSAHRTGEFARHETSFVYQGHDISNEIKINIADLESRMEQK